MGLCRTNAAIFIPKGFIQDPVDVHSPCCPGFLPIHISVSRKQPTRHSKVYNKSPIKWNPADKGT